MEKVASNGFDFDSKYFTNRHSKSNFVAVKMTEVHKK